MSDQHEHAPVDPTTPVETPESRMTGEGGPPPEHEEEKGPQDGPEYEVTEPAHESAPPGPG
ncbi:hypothetical protein [Streptomyces rubellomurinus]|uniref:Uncharacterized protein n=1 Tax=Streptomyces rubellomurinus (strain ATCC 31215) TaxID=359131 RepID=A0A0F2TJY1_STRR3|nr:hypothetical protein [Streptomyces rubellomurinus]KJS62022.1 hypothetical protein VM95_11885 [Streptomyces rubellomurinus]